MMYVCRSYCPTNNDKHCADYGLAQCEYCEWYQSGQGMAHYPIPATLDNANMAIIWSCLASCPLPNGPCNVCIDNYMDALGYMD